jgi:hypothetical protein
MGIVSLLLRVPFAAVGHLLDNSDLTLYRLGVFACIVAVALLAVNAASLMRRRLGLSLLIAGAMAVVWVLNPVTFRAISWGHPEEIVGAALLGTSAICAYLGYWSWAAVALGAAFATKQWAALVFPLLVLLLPAAHRVRFSALTAAVAIVLVLPMYLGNTDRFEKVNQRLNSDSAAATPTNVWWQSTEPAKVGYSGGARVPTEIPRRLSHPLIAVLALGLPLLWHRRRWDLLGLLPILMLLRCTLDPFSYSYHHAPLVIGLAAFEAVGRRRLPIAALLTSACIQASTWAAPHLSSNTLQAVYLGWTTVLLAYLVWESVGVEPGVRRPAPAVYSAG